MVTFKTAQSFRSSAAAFAAAASASSVLADGVYFTFSITFGRCSSIDYIIFRNSPLCKGEILCAYSVRHFYSEYVFARLGLSRFGKRVVTSVAYELEKCSFSLSGFESSEFCNIFRLFGRFSSAKNVHHCFNK